LTRVANGRATDVVTEKVCDVAWEGRWG
jgi:hypothetical protein